MIIRPAELGDVASGAACHLACWREAYAGLVDPERLATLTADNEVKVEMWRTVINQGKPLLVAVDEQDVVGFIAAGPDTEPGVAANFQLHVLNVRRTYWGTGVAQRLYDEAVGDRDAYLWVMSDNARARAFYARNGFLPDGTTKKDPDFGVPIIRMVRAVGSGRDSSSSRHGR
jgi:ribosomal protein S18 acetylase RimI-like enzyme